MEEALKLHFDRELLELLRPSGIITELDAFFDGVVVLLQQQALGIVDLYLPASD